VIRHLQPALQRAVIGAPALRVADRLTFPARSARLPSRGKLEWGRAAMKTTLLVLTALIVGGLSPSSDAGPRLAAMFRCG